MQLTEKHLAAVGAAASWLKPLQDAINKAQLATPQQIAMFLAQCAHESNGFKSLVENLNYSAQGLANTWPGRYAVDPHAAQKQPNALALRLSRNPQAIANNCYANRMGNGSEASGDGWAYRGRGCIQITGRETYAGAGQWLGVDLIGNPDLAAQPEYAALTAAWFWSTHKLATLGGNVEAVTKIINGGTLGLAHRQALYTAALAALTT